MVWARLAGIGYGRDTWPVSAPPSTSPNGSPFAALIDMEPGSSPDHLIGPPAPERGGITYGGQFMAQAVAAVYRTVSDDRFVHSFHGLFLRPGDVDQPTEWEVDRVRDGRSFSTRSVIGRQGGKEMFRAMLSLHVPEDGFEFAPATDFDRTPLPTPETVTTTYVEFCNAHPDLEPGEWFGGDRPMDILYIDPPPPGSGPPITDPQRTWTKISEPLPDDPRVHHAALLYLSDATLIDHVLLPHGHRWSDPRLTGTSLDHAMWLYRAARADQWLLYDQRVELTGGARGLATGRFFHSEDQPNGQSNLQQVAACTQEGLMRWDD